MAKADAWDAPGGNAFVRGKSDSLAGSARIIAEPAYRRLLAAEPLLRRSIPALIIVFLLVVAAARFLSLMAWHDDVERNTKAILSLGAAQLANTVTAQDLAGDAGAPERRNLLERVIQQGGMGSRHVLAITDGAFKVVAASPQSTRWEGRALNELASGGQPLFLFGERAGVMKVRIDGEAWYAALSLTGDGKAAAAALIPQAAVFADWRKTVSLNVTLFVLTAGVLIIILYAYFSQAARAQAADRIYLEAHQRIDLALVRGR